MRRGLGLAPAAALLGRAVAGTGCEYFRDTPEQECLEAAGRSGPRLPEAAALAAPGK